jgi:hypothetical protein
MPLRPLTDDQRALLNQLIDAATDAAAAQALLAGVPGPVQEVQAGHVQWLHEQIREAHRERRERIVAQSKEETRHG